MNINLVTYQKLKDAYNNLGYKFYTNDLHINLFGIRDASDVNTFNDCIGFCYVENGIPCIKKYKGSTDPGKYYLLNPMCSAGAAIVVPGYYPDLFAIGKHRGQYEALVQHSDIKVYRDRNKDTNLDFNPDSIQKGQFGINMHRTSAYGPVDYVGKYSAGCQILNSPNDLAEILKFCKISMKKYNYKYINYALFTLEQVF